MRSLTVAVFFAVANLVAPPNALGRPINDTDRFSDRPVAVHFNAGIGMPTGLRGLTVTADPIRWLFLETGAGTNDEGIQLMGGVGVRYRLARALSLNVVGGLSWGKAGPFFRLFPGGDEGCVDSDCDVNAHVLWGNVSIEVEIRLDFGLVFRPRLGFGRALQGLKRDRNIMQWGASVGYAFEL